MRILLITLFFCNYYSVLSQNLDGGAEKISLEQVIIEDIKGKNILQPASETVSIKYSTCSNEECIDIVIKNDSKDTVYIFSTVFKETSLFFSRYTMTFNKKRNEVDINLLPIIPHPFTYSPSMSQFQFLRMCPFSSYSIPVQREELYRAIGKKYKKGLMFKFKIRMAQYPNLASLPAFKSSSNTINEFYTMLDKNNYTTLVSK